MTEKAYNHLAVKTAIDRRYHRHGLGYRRPVFKASAVGMEITYWDKDGIVTARIVELVEPDFGDDKWALLDNGRKIGVGALVGVY